MSLTLISTYDPSTLCQRGHNDNQKKVLTKDIMIKTSSISNFFEMAHFTTTRVKMNEALVTSSTHAILLMAGPWLSALDRAKPFHSTSNNYHVRLQSNAPKAGAREREARFVRLLILAKHEAFTCLAEVSESQLTTPIQYSAPPFVFPCRGIA